MSHRPAITLHVEWTPDAPTDVTDQFVDLDVYHGGSTTAVERPSVAPGDGWATLEITDIEHRTDRYGVTLAADGTSIWSGWISAPELTDQRRRSRWRLTGGSAENLAEIAAFNSPGGSVVNALDAVSPTALVKRGLTDRRHRTVSVERPLGELLSQLAGALAAEIVECAGGQLAVCAVRPAGTVPTQALTGADTWVVPEVVSRDDADRLRNTVRVQLTEPVAPTGVSGHVIKERYVLAGDPGYADRSGSPIVVRFDLVIPGDAATDEAFTNPTVSFRSQRIVAVSDGRYSRLSSARAAGRGSSLPGGGLSAGVLRAEVGARVGVTVPVIVTVPADQPPSLLPAGAPATATSASRSGSWWLTDAAIADRDPAARVYYALQLYIRIQLAWGATAGSTFDSVADDASVARWGIRELRRPDWLIETNADAVALLAALSEPRREHELTLPLQQPTPSRSAAIGAIDTGDYLAVALSDAARAVSISAICLVTGRRVAVNDVGEAHVTLTCLETGAVIPGSIGAGTPVRGEGALADARGRRSATTVTGAGTPVRGEGALTDATGIAGGGTPGPLEYFTNDNADLWSPDVDDAFHVRMEVNDNNDVGKNSHQLVGVAFPDTVADSLPPGSTNNVRLQIFNTHPSYDPDKLLFNRWTLGGVRADIFSQQRAQALLNNWNTNRDKIKYFKVDGTTELTFLPTDITWDIVTLTVNNRTRYVIRGPQLTERQCLTIMNTWRTGMGFSGVRSERRDVLIGRQLLSHSGTPVAADGSLTDATGTATAATVTGTGTPVAADGSLTDATGTAAARPHAPGGLTLTAGDEQIAAAWLAPIAGPAPTGYETRHTAAGAATGAWTDRGAGHGVTITGLTAGTEYTIGVRAYNSAGAGPSISRKATPTAPNPFPPPTNVTADTTFLSSGFGRARFDAPTGAVPTGYELLRFQYQNSRNGGDWGTLTGLSRGARVTGYVTGVTSSFAVRIRASYRHADTRDVQRSDWVEVSGTRGASPGGTLPVLLTLDGLPLPLDSPPKPLAAGTWTPPV